MTMLTFCVDLFLDSAAGDNLYFYCLLYCTTLINLRGSSPEVVGCGSGVYTSQKQTLFLA